VRCPVDLPSIVSEKRGAVCKMLAGPDQR